MDPNVDVDVDIHVDVDVDVDVDIEVDADTDAYVDVASKNCRWRRHRRCRDAGIDVNRPKCWVLQILESFRRSN